MVVLKFILLAVAMFFSILIGVQTILIIVAVLASLKQKTKLNVTGPNLVSVMLCALAWAAYLIFF